MKIAVIGATGMVGQVILKLLRERNFPVTELIPVASGKSVGNTIDFKGESITILDIDTAVSKSPEIAIFSAGSGVSLDYAPKFAEQGTYVIDNSSAWRMDPNKKLIVPEINGESLAPEDRIIANPNCSTIQMVMALYPLHLTYGLKRVVVSTYQSISGTGVKAVRQMENERTEEKGEMVYPYRIDQNCLPHCDDFLDNDYTKEEMKLVNETRKILNNQEIGITATAVRVPVTGGHSESVNVEFKKEFDLGEVRRILSNTSGVVVKDNPMANMYPMPYYSYEKDEVFVGRIRVDESQPNTLNMWIVADNLRKGAATNAIQIAEFVKDNILAKAVK